MISTPSDLSFPKLSRTRPTIAVSSCLVGQRVRHDGDHRADPFLRDVLPGSVDVVPVCPEYEVGMGVPREPIQLEVVDEEERVRGVRSRVDWTRPLAELARRRLRELSERGVTGYVFKSRSPSCGLRDVPRFEEERVVGRGPGAYARLFRDRSVTMACEDENALADGARRDLFLTRVFALHRLGVLLQDRPTGHKLRYFHRREAFLLLSHDLEGALGLDEMLGEPIRSPSTVVAYADRFRAILARAPSRERHAEVLRRLAACLEGAASGAELRELEETVESFESGAVSLVRARSRLLAVARQVRSVSLRAQSFLNPYPLVLAMEAESGRGEAPPARSAPPEPTSRSADAQGR